MGRMDYLAMKTDPTSEDLISSDMNELKLAAKKLISDATKLGGLGFGTSFLKWVASFAAM
ncbi:cold regulated membrane protein [Corchorus olitorius]|uniref:Cold regulated membrane protein n=1 Tax=Corchorus olitorius TaxID=93759 RepID=A0A1R3INQ7_9ROSI|nr:cold regulated membrane protein [Corchorus olitorius]